MSLPDALSSIRTGFPSASPKSELESGDLSSVCEDVQLLVEDHFERTQIGPVCDGVVWNPGILWQAPVHFELDALSLLQSQVALETVSVWNPLYESHRLYLGYSLRDLLSSFPYADQYTHLQVLCADAYTPEWIPLDQAMEGFLAIEDISQDSVKAIAPFEEVPGPAYLLWPESHPFAQQKHRWVYNVTGLRWVNQEESRAESNVDAWLSVKKPAKPRFFAETLGPLLAVGLTRDLVLRGGLLHYLRNIP